jgi:RNase P/RNase MRP subunit p29
MEDPQEYVGETVNVLPTWDDTFFEFTGKVIGVRRGCLQVRDQDDAVHEVEVGQVTKVTEAPKVPERSDPPSEQELMERQTTMLRQDGKSWEEIARLYGEMLIREREERSQLINQKNRAEELLRANQAKEG